MKKTMIAALALFGLAAAAHAQIAKQEPPSQFQIPSAVYTPPQPVPTGFSLQVATVTPAFNLMTVNRNAALSLRFTVTTTAGLMYTVDFIRAPGTFPTPLSDTTWTLMVESMIHFHYYRSAYMQLPRDPAPGMILNGLYRWGSMSTACIASVYSELLLNIYQPLAFGTGGRMWDVKGGMVDAKFHEPRNITLGGQTFRTFGHVNIRRHDATPFALHLNYDLSHTRLLAPDGLITKLYWRAPMIVSTGHPWVFVTNSTGLMDHNTRLVQNPTTFQ